VTPFTDILRQVRKGLLVEQLDEQMQKLIQAIDSTGKGGSLTLTVNIKPSKTGGWDKNFAFDIKAKLPARSAPEAVFFSNPDGDLSRDDPDQRPLFEDAESFKRSN
jgi:hypothetical protein